MAEFDQIANNNSCFWLAAGRKEVFGAEINVAFLCNREKSINVLDRHATTRAALFFCCFPRMNACSVYPCDPGNFGGSTE